MKKSIIRISVISILLLAAAPSMLLSQGKKEKTNRGTNKKAEAAANGKIQLFNGKDLNNWVFYLKDASVDPKTVFTVQNGVIHVKGDPFGYMRTIEEYSDYDLHVEYRYPVEATNSGVFIHAQKPDTIWLKCIECQLMAGNAGDFVCMNGAEMKERVDKTKRVVKKMGASTEKPAGEWNTLDVRTRGNTIEVKVNGTLQNKGTGLNVSKGSICLQSEGKDIEFRNVFLVKQKK